MSEAEITYYKWLIATYRNVNEELQNDVVRQRETIGELLEYRNENEKLKNETLRLRETVAELTEESYFIQFSNTTNKISNKWNKITDRNFWNLPNAWTLFKNPFCQSWRIFFRDWKISKDPTKIPPKKMSKKKSKIPPTEKLPDSLLNSLQDW